MRSSNPMKHARELIECGIQSIDIQDQKTPMLWVRRRSGTKDQEVEANIPSLNKETQALILAPTTFRLDLCQAMSH